MANGTTAHTHTPAANGRRTRSTRAKPTDTAPAELAIAVSAKTRALITGIKDDFLSFTDGFMAVTQERATLAPRFMKAFMAWAQESGGSFAAFVRVLDPRVPEDRDGYRAHPSYQAADYLRRLQAGAGREQATVPEGERPMSPYQALAYLVATVMPIVDPSGSVWNAFVREMHWTEEQAQRVKVLATKVGAVKLPPRTKSELLAHAS